MTLGGTETYADVYGLGRVLGSVIQNERCPLGIGLHQSMFGESMH